MKKFISPLLIFLAGITWGLSCIFVRGLREQGFTNNEITFLRFLFASIAICIIFFIFDRKSFKIKLKNSWIFICSGAIGMFLTSLCYFSTQYNASVSVACILMYTSPIFVTVMAKIFFKEKITLVKVVCLFFTFGGIILSSLDGNVGNLTFPVFMVGLGSGLFYASYSIFSRFAFNNGYTSENILIYSFIFGAIASSFTVDYNHLFSVIANINYNLTDMILLSLLATVTPYMLYTIGLKGIDTGKAAIIACVEIVSASIVGMILYSEFPSWLAIIGLIIVIASVVALNLIGQKDKNNLGKKIYEEKRNW